jgi:hypothetical protein
VITVINRVQQLNWRFQTDIDTMQEITSRKTNKFIITIIHLKALVKAKNNSMIFLLFYVVNAFFLII